MGLFKRKEEKTEVISVRERRSAKAEFDELRQRAKPAATIWQGA